MSTQLERNFWPSEGSTDSTHWAVPSRILKQPQRQIYYRRGIAAFCMVELRATV